MPIGVSVRNCRETELTARRWVVSQSVGCVQNVTACNGLSGSVWVGTDVSKSFVGTLTLSGKNESTKAFSTIPV